MRKHTTPTTVRPQGPVDKFEEKFESGEYTVVACDRIDGTRMFAVLAQHPTSGKWLTGRIDLSAPHPKNRVVRGEDAALWVVEDIARTDHAERVAGDIW